MNGEDWAKVLADAECRSGVFSVSQAEARGVDERAVQHRVARGELVRVQRGVLHVKGAPPSFAMRLQAAILHLGTSVAVSHVAAVAALHLDGDTKSVLRAEAIRRIDVWLPPGMHAGRSTPSLRMHRTKVLPDHHRTFVDGIPITSAARTIVDIAATTSAEHLEDLGENARRMGLMTIAELERVLDDVGKRRGVVAVRKYIEHQSGHSALHHRLEVKTARLLRSARLSGLFERQVAVATSSATLFRVDLGNIVRRVAIECEGFRWHGSHLQWKHDRARMAAIEAAGWRVVAVTWDDITKRPEEAIQRIRLAIGELP